MADEIQGYTTDLSNFIPEVWSKKLARIAKQHTRFIERNVNRNWEGEIRNFGDKVRIAYPDPQNVAVAISDNASEVCPVPGNVKPGSTTLDINKLATYSLKFSDVDLVRSQFDVLEGYNAIAMQKLGDMKDKQVMVEVIKEAGYQLGTPEAPVAVTVDNIYDYLVDIRMQLTQNGVLNSDGFYSFKGNEEEPEMLAPVFTVEPRLFGLMLKSTQLTHPTANGDQVIKDGRLAMMAGFEIDTNTVLGTLTTADVAGLAENAAVGIACTRMATTYANQFTKVERIRDPQCFADIIRGIELYGFKVIHPEAAAVAFIQRPAANGLTKVKPALGSEE